MATSDNIHSRLSELAEPLRDQLDDLVKEIAQAEESLGALRQAKRDLTYVLARIDPTYVDAEVKRFKKSKPTSEPRRRQGQASMTPAIRDWVMEHREDLSKDGGFSAASMIRGGFDLVSQSTLNRALLTLHEEGLLRIDHTGFGGSRYYKVVGNG